MMGLGSAIGAGLFLGTGQGIALAGPAVIVSYLVAGVIVILLMWMLAEMASAIPSSGSFSTYAELGIGRWAGFTVGWLYWFTLIMVLGVEITGASQILHGWLTAVPQWVIALVLVTFFAVVNLIGVRNFGEFEFWFAAIKITAIIGFLAVGVALACGWLPGRPALGLDVMLGHGGFAPTGIAGITSALLVVIFAFGGIEIITIAAAEAHDPHRSIVRAARNIVWRILLFYIGSVFIMVLVLPWNSPQLLDGPFVAVLTAAGLRGAAAVMAAVVVIALLSAFNANVYGTSRMAYSLSQRGDGSRRLLAVSSRGVPVNAVWTSVFFALISVFLNWWLPEKILGVLLNAVGSSLLVLWIFIAVSHLRLRPRLEREGKLHLRTRGFPYVTYATLALLIGVALLMMTAASTRSQLLSTVVLTAAIVAAYGLHRRVVARR
ncbi:aromatic amino acid transport protein AroP [Rarobacter incanus]